MKFTKYILGTGTILLSLQSRACSFFLQDHIELPFNNVTLSNVDRLSLVRHYLTAREWTKEGASVEVDAAAFENENNPRDLAALRGRNVKAFLIQLGLDSEDIHVKERVIEFSRGKVDPDDKWQVGVEFVPICSSSECQDLCNASYAARANAPAPAIGNNDFSCHDSREPKQARLLETDVWTARTTEKSLTLFGRSGVGTQKALANICYRITTSARAYIGMTDDQGRTERMQLLGPEHTKIEMKIDADSPAEGGRN